MAKETFHKGKEQAELKEQAVEAAPGPVVDTLEDYRSALDNAQVEGLEYIEVSDRIFNKMKPGSQSIDSFTAGNPGVRVYRLGTREAIERIENMSVADYHDYMAKLRTSKDH